MWLIILILSIALVAALFYIIRICFLISKVSLTVPFPSTFAEPSHHKEERVEFPTANGALLEGRWIASKKPSSTIILFCHELGGDLNTWHKYGHFLPEFGFNVFTFNFRKPTSKHDGIMHFTTGQWVTRHDVEDVLSAIRFIRENPLGQNKAIGIFGISKGANAALAAMSQTDKIGAVVTDGAFSTVETCIDYIRKWISIFVPYPWLYKNVPYWLYRNMLRLSLWISSAKLRCWFVSIEKSLRHTNVPIYFIHSENDNYVSPRQAQYLFNITHSHEGLWIVPGARHNQAVEVLPAEYKEKVISFFSENLD